MTKVAFFFIYAQFFLTNLQNFITNPPFFVKKAKYNSFSLSQIRCFSHPRVDVGIDVLLQNRFIAPKYHPDLQCNSAAKNLLERVAPGAATEQTDNQHVKKNLIAYGKPDTRKLPAARAHALRGGGRAGVCPIHSRVGRLYGRNARVIDL